MDTRLGQSKQETMEQRRQKRKKDEHVVATKSSKWTASECICTPSCHPRSLVTHVFFCPRNVDEKPNILNGLRALRAYPFPLSKSPAGVPRQIISLQLPDEDRTRHVILDAVDPYPLRPHVHNVKRNAPQQRSCNPPPARQHR